MASVHERLRTLEDAADERDLTPVAWWIGTAHHDEMLAALADDEDTEISTEGQRLRAIEGRDVKVLDESPQRFALWCEEGALDL